MNPALSREATPAHVRRLLSFAYVALAATALYFIRTQRWEDSFLSVANIVMLFLGVLPILSWLRRNDNTYPASEFLLLTTVPFYAVPALTNHEALIEYPESLILQATFVVIAFQVGCILGSFVAARTHQPRTSRSSPWWAEELLKEKSMGVTAYSSVIFTLWLIVSSFTDLVPSNLTGTLRAVFFGLGIISMFIQARLWGLGQLSHTAKIVLVVNVIVQVLLTFLSLMLITGMGLILTAAIGFFSSARRVPWLPLVIALPIFAVLHNGKAQMRQIYWNGQTPMPKIAELPSFFTQWVEFGLAREDAENTMKDKALTYSLMRRASLFQIVCIAVDSIPERTDFLRGESYTLILPQIFPRFLWPNKPSPHLSVKLLSVKLGIMTTEEAETTSVGFGTLSEAYANFGHIAVAALGFTFGFCFRRLVIATVDCATLSPAGLFRILCLIWCLSSEVTLAVWTSSLYQACIAIGATILAIRPFVKD